MLPEYLVKGENSKNTVCDMALNISNEVFTVNKGANM
jgi:hypothetical protein